jgi:hypothetical protein
MEIAALEGGMNEVPLSVHTHGWRGGGDPVENGVSKGEE